MLCKIMIQSVYSEMGKYLLETNRDLREKAWRKIAERRMQDKDQLVQTFAKSPLSSISNHQGEFIFRSYLEVTFIANNSLQLHTFRGKP